MLSLLSNFWSRAIRTKAQLPWLSTRTTLFMCSWLLAHRRQTAKKKDHPNLLPVLEVALEQRISLRRIGFGWLRSPISINQESEDNIELLPLYHVPCVTLCTLSLSCQSTLTKRQKKKKKKDCQMSVYHKADPGELIQWVTHESRSSAASNSGLIRIGTQPRTADAWYHDSCRPRGVVNWDFSAIFDRLFDRLPVRISTSDLHHWILRKKSFISELMILECSFPLRSQTQSRESDWTFGDGRFCVQLCVETLYKRANFGGTFDQLFLGIFLCNFYTRCPSTFSIPQCKKVKNGQKLKSGGGGFLP